MRIVFMGTPAFAVPCLKALVKNGMDVAGVFTQPDRPKGRDMVLGSVLISFFYMQISSFPSTIY